MNENEYFLRFIKTYGLLLLLISIIILYSIIHYIKSLESFDNLNFCELETTFDTFKKKIIFVSGFYVNYESIYDNFYSYIYDDISFNSDVYKEQGNLLKKLFEPHNIHLQNILIDNIMTGHIYGVISSFPCKITTTNISNSLVKICKRNYPNIINYNYDILNNYDTSFNKYTCITNFSHNIYYYNEEKLNTYFRNVNNLLIHKGFFVINFINNFKYFNYIYGNINNDPNFFFTNYNYKVYFTSEEKKIQCEELISPKRNSKKIRSNIHTLYKHYKNNIIHLCNINNFTLIQTIEKSKYKKYYGYLIFQKST